MRLGFLVVGSTMLTLLTQIGLVISTMAPWGCCWLGLTCFLTMLIPSTVTLFSLGWVALILPVRPLYLPARTTTRSPFLRRILKGLAAILDFLVEILITVPPALMKLSWRSPGHAVRVARDRRYGWPGEACHRR